MELKLTREGQDVYTANPIPNGGRVWGVCGVREKRLTSANDINDRIFLSLVLSPE